MELILSFVLSFFLPFIWVFYLDKKDCHPEPLPWLIFAFILGILSSILSYLTQFYFVYFLKLENIYEPKILFLSAFAEEFFKFLLVFLFIFPSKVFDEPIDGMIYMIFSAFGFSFVENLLYALKSQEEVIRILFLRFLSANFLHILASALIGFSYVYYKRHRNLFFFLVSFLGAIYLHYFYNLSIIRKGLLSYIFPLLWSIFFIVLVELDYLRYRENGRRK